MSYDPGVSRVAMLLALIALICAVRGMYIGNIPDLLGGIVFALLANFLKWDDPDF